MNGYIKLFRSIEKWEWYTDVNTKTLFIHCLIKANHKDAKWRGIHIPAGSFISSYAKLSKETGLSVMSVRTSLKRLKSTGELTHETTSDYSLINLVNWSQYQSDDDEDNTEDNTLPNKQVTSNQQASNKQVTTNKNEKNEKNDKNIKNIGVFDKFAEDNQTLLKALNDYSVMRSKIKKPLTDRAKELLVDKLVKLQKDGEDIIECINNSTFNSWLGVFPIKTKEPKRSGKVEKITEYAPIETNMSNKEQEALAKRFAELGGI